MAPDGSGSPQRISTTIDDQPYSFFTVGWSADGKSIVTQAGTTDSDIYVVPADGTGDRNLTQQPGIDGIPKWSPDDTKVAYLKGMNLLAIVPATGGPSQSLGSISGTPTWSPDGTKLAVGQSMGSAAISVVDAVSGTVLARIATPDQSFPAQAHYPSWQRVAP
jgi:Tol biopolymer transport system component